MLVLLRDLYATKNPASLAGFHMIIYNSVGAYFLYFCTFLLLLGHPV